MSAFTYAERYAVNTEAGGDPQGWQLIQIAVCPERQYRARPAEHELSKDQWARAIHLWFAAQRLRALRHVAAEAHADRAGYRARSI